MCSAFIALAAWGQSPAPGELPMQVLPLEIRINGVAGGLWPVLTRGNTHYLPDEAFTTWRLERNPQADTLQHRGLRYTSLSSLPGSQTDLNATSGLLSLTVAAQAFAATRLVRQLDSVLEIDPAIPSFFLNYDFSVSHAKPVQQPATRSLGVAGEAGYSSQWGVLTQSYVGQAVTRGAEDERTLTRLNTTFRRDFPTQRLSLSLGDGATRTGYLGRPAYFGGVQFGTNFSLVPGFSRNPIPIINGETRAPSTVQLYVDNVLRQTTNVPSGPFTLDTLPVLSGNGNVSVVVRDLLGRETVITQPFIVSADLLAPGLNDWSVELGKLRRNLGTSSNDYGDAFAAGLWRRGLSPTLTLEGRAERTPDLATAGGSAVVALGGRYLARAGVAASEEATLGAGHRWVGGLDWQDRLNSFLVAGEANSRDFRELGQPRTVLPARWQLTAQATGQLSPPYGRIGAGVVAQQGFDERRTSVLSVSHSIELRNRWLLGTSYTRAFGSQGGGYNLSLSLNIPLDRRTSATVSSQFTSERIDARTSVAQSPEGAYGTGWRASASHQDRLRAEAGLFHFGPHGIVSAELDAGRDQVNVRAGAGGTLLLAGGKVAALQRHEGSAVLVEVPGYPGIGVGLGPRASTQTDKNGRALITGLNAFQANPVQLAANDLPITAEIQNIEQMTVPAARSVSRVTFKVRGGRGALVRILLDDGEPAPAGSAVRVVGDEREFLVSRRGDAYVTGLKELNALQLTWKGRSCALTILIPPGPVDEIARIGPLACKEVER